MNFHWTRIPETLQISKTTNQRENLSFSDPTHSPSHCGGLLDLAARTAQYIGLG